jgi:hypothetical protein
MIYINSLPLSFALCEGMSNRERERERERERCTCTLWEHVGACESSFALSEGMSNHECSLKTTQKTNSERGREGEI